MKLLSQTKALNRLKALKDGLRSRMTAEFEHRAKSCLTCETPGACCLDAHFVNVHISRLEAVAIKQVIAEIPKERQVEIEARINATIRKYSLTADGDTFAQTYACPLFEKGIGCLVHSRAKPLPCMTHACYENKKDLPPGNLLAEQEVKVDELNTNTYGHPQPWLPLPLAIRHS